VAQFEIGKSVFLCVYLIKNNRPSSGKVVIARVIKQSDATELLASTTLPETSEPGKYVFEWTSAPEEVINLLAIYDVGGKIFAEPIEIISRITVLETDLVIEIEDESALTIDVTDENELELELTEDDDLIIETEDEDLEITIEEDSQLITELEC